MKSEIVKSYLPKYEKNSGRLRARQKGNKFCMNLGKLRLPILHHQCSQLTIIDSTCPFTAVRVHS
jgi:hypothetical protein